MKQRKRKKLLYCQLRNSKLMALASIRTIVAGWAASQPLIVRAWVFGSRARGAARTDSDLDVAIEVATLPGDSGPLTTFIGESDKLKRSLQACVPVNVHLHWYGGLSETQPIHDGLQQSSILVYPAD